MGSMTAIISQIDLGRPLDGRVASLHLLESTVRFDITEPGAGTPPTINVLDEAIGRRCAPPGNDVRCDSSFP